MFGWWGAYVDLIEWFLRELTDLTGNVGVAIIIFTIILKTILLPLTVKSIKSTAAMQELQPKIKELQKKYSKDRQKLSEETMRLYQEYQINPAAGCLPLLIQIPIFFGLYAAVSDISRGGGSFLWIDNLATADPYKILPIMAGVFQFIQTKMMRPANAPKVTDPQQAMMNTMMNFMPLMVVVFGWTFAAGAVLYWATQSVYSVIQQWFITGWGQIKNWAPWLPELPEHRRLGHRKQPLERREVGEYQAKGLMGVMQRRLKAMEAQQQQRAGHTQDQESSETEVTPPASRSGSASASGKRQGKQRSAQQAKGQTQPQPNLGNVSGGSTPVDGRATRVMTGRSRSSRRGNGRSGS